MHLISFLLIILYSPLVYNSSNIFLKSFGSYNYPFTYSAVIYANSGSSAVNWAKNQGRPLHVIGDGDFTVIDGKLYSYVGTDDEVTVPDTVTSIGRYAFPGNDRPGVSRSRKL